MTSRLIPEIQVIELEVNTRCNRRCSYCPSGLLQYRSAERRMNAVLYDRLLQQFAEIGFCGRLSLHHFNEPLLRKDLEVLVRKAREALPRAFLVIYTNGDLLDDARYHRLMDAGVDRFLVTRHDYSPFPTRPFQEVQTPKDFPHSSRGGTVAPVFGPLCLPCFAPDEMLIVGHDGRVVLCHEDAKKLFVLGDLSTQSLAEVWQSPRLRALRAALRAGDRSAVGGVCTSCDNRLHPLAGDAI